MLVLGIVFEYLILHNEHGVSFAISEFLLTSDVSSRAPFEIADKSPLHIFSVSFFLLHISYLESVYTLFALNYLCRCI